MDRRIKFSHPCHAVDLGHGDHGRSDCDGFSLVGAALWLGAARQHGRLGPTSVLQYPEMRRGRQLRDFAMRHPNRFTIQLAAPMILAAALLLAMIVEWALSIE